MWCQSLIASLAFFVVLILPAPAKAEVGFLGDLEGSWQRLKGFVDDGRILYWNGDKIEVRGDNVFVFAGDSVDRGPHGMKIVDTLVDLKKRYPQQVILLAGNRDGHKLALAIPENQVDGPNGGKLWNPQSVQALLARMNAAKAFEHRQQELEQTLSHSVSAQEVTDSLVGDVLQGGRILEYLKLTQLAYHDVQTKSLYVHGGLSVSNIGVVPGQQQRVEVLADWVAQLNAWWASLVENLDQNEKRQAVRNYVKDPAGLVYGRFSDNTGNPQIPARPVVEYLKKNSVHVVAVGHTPAGEMPGIVSSPFLKLILGDVSYSSELATTMIRVTALQIEIDTQMKDGRQIEARLPLIGIAPDGMGGVFGGYRIVGRLKRTVSADNAGQLLGWKVVMPGFKNTYRPMNHCALALIVTNGVRR